MSSQSVPARSIIHVGMDVHKDSITTALLPAGAKAPTPLERLPNDLPKLKKWLARVARDGDIRACYEASGAGYVRHRVPEEWGYACELIAPSLIPKRPGVQRTHDKRDAVQLARLYRAASASARSRKPETVTAGTSSSRRRGVIATGRKPAWISNGGNRGSLRP